MVPLENSVGGSVPTTIDELATGRPLVIDARAAPAGRVRAAGPAGHDARPTSAPWPGTRRRTCSAGAGCASTCRRPTRWRPRPTRTPPGWSPTGAGTRRWRPAPPPRCTAWTSSPTTCTTCPARETRFVLVTRPHAPGPSTGSDKTSLVLVIGQDHPGALLEILTEFAVRGINLTRIESRPDRRRHRRLLLRRGRRGPHRRGQGRRGADRPAPDLRRRALPGVLPARRRASGPALRRGVSDAEYGQAQAWLARVRDGRA